MSADAPHALAHVPVMLAEVMRLLDPKPGEIVADGTLGLGGHSEALRAALGGDGLLLALDRDPDMARRAEARLAASPGAPFKIIVANFDEMDAHLSFLTGGPADAILLDLGVASPHLDESARGFSYRVDGPLDMRMTPGEGPSAGEWINHVREQELADVLWTCGEERFARRIARAIVEARRRAPVRRTLELADIISRVAPPGRRGLHPARRTFQAIRISLNRELEHLDRFLEKLPRLLKEGGRCAVISYHSLEDRRVKNAFRQGAKEGHYELLTRKPLRPSLDEVRANPRSRSARLRAVRNVATGIEP